MNGSGYPDGAASFGRGIIPRCPERHAAYFESQFADPNSNFYNTANVVAVPAHALDQGLIGE